MLDRLKAALALAESLNFHRAAQRLAGFALDVVLEEPDPFHDGPPLADTFTDGIVFDK